jgi:UDP-glucuronate 4-epimerase
MRHSVRHVLVTGDAGFIGCHFVDRLLADGFRVTGFDNFDPFYDPAIKARNIAAHLANPRYTLVRGDLRDPATLAPIEASDVDAIVHLAARAGVQPSLADPVGYQEVNVTGTQYLLELAKRRRITPFVFASSSSVYGVNPNVPWREDDHVLQPISPYASTKISGELLGHVYSHLYGIRFIALRFFTVYGPRQRPDLAIHKFARKLLARQPITLYGDGGTRRDYTYVADVVEGVRAALDYSGSNYEIINLGNDRTVTLLELVKQLEATLGVHAEIAHVPEQPGDVSQTWASIEKARKLLGYAPRTTFAEGIASFAAWLERTPNPEPEPRTPNLEL